MEKKTVFLELSCELINKIDQMNTLGDRSAFISNLLEKQMQRQEMNHDIKPNTELTTRMEELAGSLGTRGEINLVKNSGHPVGTFNIDTIQGFEDLAKKIQEVSEDPVVRIKARRLI
ncbi:MAG TPA: hypothetical protein ENN45_01925 [Bacteroidetes bacterium]|nr:hypothetical protein [Bacteroidota bacterium]